MNKSENLRIWDKTQKKFIEIIDLKVNQEDPNIGNVILENGVILEYPKDVDVMVFAEIKDINEKKLFEKDVIKFTLGNITSYALILRMYHYFTLKSILNNTVIPYGLIKDTIEYAGNVWQNPELFEGELIVMHEEENFSDNEPVVINDIELPASKNHFALSQLTKAFAFYPNYYKQVSDALNPLGYLTAILEQVQQDPIERELILGKYESIVGSETVKKQMSDMWEIFNK